MRNFNGVNKALGDCTVRQTMLGQTRPVFSIQISILEFHGDY